MVSFQKWSGRRRGYTFFLFCVNGETRTFRDLVNRTVIPGIRRYRYLAGLTLDNGLIQVPEREISYGSISYKKMCQEFYDILGITRPVI